jgi:hypothetical protein
MPPASVTRFCPANTWTQVEWTVHLPFLSRQWNAGGTTVRWRWFSSGPPFYWEGTFTGTACITIGPGLYTSLEFNPVSSVTVVASAAGC